MSDIPPVIPSDISNDGREVWDWATKLGQWSARQHNMRVLASDISSHSSKTCGHCNDWMKSRVCPRERNERGMSRGPSSGDFGCGQFSRKSYLDDLISQKSKELSDLRGDAS